MLENTWREIDYRLDVLRATKWAHVEVYWCVVKKLLELSYILIKKYVFIPRSFLVKNVCNEGKTLWSPCIFTSFITREMFLGIQWKSLSQPKVDTEHTSNTSVAGYNAPTLHQLLVIISVQDLQKAQTHCTCKKQYLLKEVGVVLKAEEGHCVGQHPYVPAPAVIVRLAPFPVFVPDTQDLVRYSVGVGTLIVGVGVETWNTVYTMQGKNVLHVVAWNTLCVHTAG